MGDVISAPTATLELEVGGLTDVGLVREHNEDFLGDFSLEYPDRLASHGRLFAIADGMGGHAMGEIASRFAVDTLFDTYYHAPTDDLATALYASFEAANASVYHQSRIRATEMGTTLVVALLHETTLMIASVGDSRLYRLRRGQLQQLTRDHSLVAEQLRRGIITEEQARQSRSQNVLTRCVGLRPIIDVDLTETPLVAGDLILLCSDGLHGLVTADEMTQLLLAHPPSTAVTKLVALANARGGLDNITCLAIRVAAVPCPATDENEDAAPDEVEDAAAAATSDDTAG